MSLTPTSVEMIKEFLHDVKQPVNLIKVIAQDIKRDVAKNRLELEHLPEAMTEIEEAVERLVARVDAFRQHLIDDEGVSPPQKR